MSNTQAPSGSGPAPARPTGLAAPSGSHDQRTPQVEGGASSVVETRSNEHDDFDDDSIDDESTVKGIRRGKRRASPTSSLPSLFVVPVPTETSAYEAQILLSDATLALQILIEALGIESVAWLDSAFNLPLLIEGAEEAGGAMVTQGAQFLVGGSLLRKHFFICEDAAEEPNVVLAIALAAIWYYDPRFRGAPTPLTLYFMIYNLRRAIRMPVLVDLDISLTDISVPAILSQFGINTSVVPHLDTPASPLVPQAGPGNADGEGGQTSVQGNCFEAAQPSAPDNSSEAAQSSVSSVQGTADHSARSAQPSVQSSVEGFGEPAPLSEPSGRKRTAIANLEARSRREQSRFPARFSMQYIRLQAKDAMKTLTFGKGKSGTSSFNTTALATPGDDLQDLAPPTATGPSTGVATSTGLDTGAVGGNVGSVSSIHDSANNVAGPAPNATNNAASNVTIVGGNHAATSNANNGAAVTSITLSNGVVVQLPPDTRIFTIASSDADGLMNNEYWQEFVAPALPGGTTPSYAVSLGYLIRNRISDRVHEVV